MRVVKLRNSYEKLRSSYWFIPSLMAVMAGVIAYDLLILDQYNERNRLIDLSWITLTGAEGARSILSTIASSMITVVAIVFSITIVSLSLASQQFGPRLLQNFMRDRGNQYVLGTVTATFLYCLLVLRTISATTPNEPVPHISILFGVGLAILSVGVLIYFIHHVSESIQVTTIVAGVSRDLEAVIERLFPQKVDQTPVTHVPELDLAGELPNDFDQQSQVIPSTRGGYLQAIDQDGLLALAAKNNLIIQILHRHGHFILPAADLVRVWPKEASEDKALAEAINAHFITGPKRTQAQDLEFLINELVEIAGKALSPGINDPFTAITCIDHLGAQLSALAQRVFPSVVVRDRESRVRVVAYPVNFECLVDAAFNQIRQYGRNDAAITIRLLETIEKVIPFTWSHEQRNALLRQAAMIERGSHKGLPEEEDRKQAHERYLKIFTTLERCFGLTAGA